VETGIYRQQSLAESADYVGRGSKQKAWNVSDKLKSVERIAHYDGQTKLS